MMMTSVNGRRVTADVGLTVPLADVGDAYEVGGKAHNLARLIRLGHPVPDGFVVTRAALARFLDEHDLLPMIEIAATGLDVRHPGGIRAAAETIGALIRNCPLPAAVSADLDLALMPFLQDILIVRSSAVGEDSGDASFAGQLDSIADVSGASLIRRAILDVWASRWSARALTYQLARNTALDGMGVIVQRQVASAVSGVLFTVAPDHDGEMLVEYCAGAGEALVSGRVNPASARIDRRTLRTLSAAPFAGDGTAGALLELPALARRALDIERAFGCPQDIEWTVGHDGHLWIVQSRPITVAARPGRAQPTLDERAAAGDPRRRVYWSNANVNENFPQPITPLLYSIARTGYYHYFRNLALAFGLSRRRVAAMEQPLGQIIGVHGARMYYNLTSIHGILRSAPFGDLLAAWFNQFVGSEDTDTPAFGDAAEGARTAGGRSWRLAQAGELVVIALKTSWQYLFVTRRVERFERTVADFAERTHPRRLAARSRRDLLDDFRAFLEIRNHRWLDASLADTASMVCYGALQRWLSLAFPGADQAALHNSLLKALPGLPSGMPALKLWELSRLVRRDPRLLHLLATSTGDEALATIRRDAAFASFGRALDSYLEDWGFRCSGELMLTVRSFQEDPAQLIELIKAYVRSDGESPADQLREQRAARIRDTGRVAEALRQRRLVRYLPFVNQWHAVSMLLRRTQASIILRERARLKQALLYSRLRRIALTLGDRLVSEGRLDRAEDTFFLTASEVDELVSGAAMFPDHQRQLVAVRRAAHAELSVVAPPDTMTLAEGAYAASRPADRATSTESGEANGTFRGVGVCGGTTTARAAVLSDVTEAHLLEPGDVLITRQTDPGWGAVFPLISGLVMERGGMLSHGAIIAREFGIPSVVGISEATRLIPHGSIVHLDGDLGLVRITAGVADERATLAASRAS